jgi:hypothetical protein
MLLPTHPHLSYITNNADFPTAITAQAGTAVTAGGSANTYGTWTQIHAGLTYASEWVKIALQGVETSADVISATTLNAYFDIGIGPNSGEVTVIAEKLGGPNAYGMGHIYFMPLRIPPDTPVWARHQNTAASAKGAVAISVQGGNMNPGTINTVSRIVALGATTASTTGTTITPTSGSEDAWTEIVASSAEDYAGVMISPMFRVDTSTTAKVTWLDVGVGGSGSEFVVGDMLTTEYLYGTGERHSSICLPSFIGIPAGSRICARAGGNVAADTSCSVIVYGFVH